MKISTIVSVFSIGFLSYYFYNYFKSDYEEKNQNLTLVIEEESETIMEVEEEPLTPSQQIVYDHFQIAHR
jgi:hypothetical protein